METPTTFQSAVRALLTGLALALVISILVTMYGWLSGWRLVTQFSDGLFVVGSAVIIFGLLAVWGGFTSRGDFAMTYAQSVSDMSLSERTRLWVLDSLRGYNVVVVASICGATMIGLSVLIYEVFS